MWLFSNKQGIKLGRNKICLWGCVEGIDFFAWLRNIYEWGCFFVRSRGDHFFC